MAFDFSLDEWLALSKNELSAYVREKHIAVLMSVDGTRRHYLLSQPVLNNTITDFEDYARHSAYAYVRLYEVLFSLGIETVMTPLFYPPNFQRSADYLHRSMEMNKLLLCHEPFLGLYQRWNLRVRLYGDYLSAPNASPIRGELENLQNSLIETTPDGERLLLYGYSAGSFTEEVVAHTVQLTTMLGRAPTVEEVRQACFPDGPHKLNILIKSGWMRVGMLLPPILDGGSTEFYILRYLPLDLQEEAMRRILYDYLFLRRAAPDDDADYTMSDLEDLNTYYNKNKDSVIGLGDLVGPGLWYAVR